MRKFLNQAGTEAMWHVPGSKHTLVHNRSIGAQYKGIIRWSVCALEQRNNMGPFHLPHAVLCYATCPTFAIHSRKNATMNIL